MTGDWPIDEAAFIRVAVEHYGAEGTALGGADADAREAAAYALGEQLAAHARLIRLDPDPAQSRIHALREELRGAVPGWNRDKLATSRMSNLADELLALLAEPAVESLLRSQALTYFADDGTAATWLARTQTALDDLASISLMATDGERTLLRKQGAPELPLLSAYLQRARIAYRHTIGALRDETRLEAPRAWPGTSSQFLNLVSEIAPLVAPEWSEADVQDRLPTRLQYLAERHDDASKSGRSRSQTKHRN